MEHQSNGHTSAGIETSNSNKLKKCDDYCENRKSTSKLNTTVVRCPDGINQTVHNRFCTSCLKKIDPENYFLWEFMDFCSIFCISKFQGLNFKCAFCSNFINNTLFGKFYTNLQKNFKFFCSSRCADHSKLTLKTCSCCQSVIASNSSMSFNSDANNVSFCSELCCDMFNNVIKPKKVPYSTICCVCKQNKSITIILKHDEMSKYFCSKRCLTAYSFVKLHAATEQCTMCETYFSEKTLSSFRVYYEKVALHFCSTTCQNIYKALKAKPVCCTWCQNKKDDFSMIRKFSNTFPKHIFICSVYCFKLYECTMFAEVSPTSASNIQGIIASQYTDNILISNINREVNKQIVVTTKKIIDQRNVATMCFIPKANKDVMVSPHVSHKYTQTEDVKEAILPIPVPIYLPTPMAMYSIPIPTPVPFVLPVPVPIFVPMSKQLYLNFENEIESTYRKIPNNPYEAELLKIADIIADGEENQFETQSDNQIYKQNYSPSFKRTLEPTTDTIEFEGVTKKIKSTNKRKPTDIFDLDSCDSRSNEEVISTVSNSANKVSLNYHLAVEALKHWLNTKQSSCQKPVVVKKTSTTDILHMPPDKLNLILDSFIVNLKKPNRSEYAPDTIYYLCLGIQYFLLENGRSDNIFLDKSYKKFSDTLNTLTEKFNCFYSEVPHFVVTRVVEEHLWESKQLGDHSPQVLLNTLVFFNTKYYHCSTVEEHLNISFSQILKLWSKKAKSKSMVLRFHPKNYKGNKRLYEQYCNEANPSRCPIKLYQYYLSKCPETVKTSNNVFYLEPEQYCTSDSPLWYMNTSLSEETLTKMINRMKMVKEINVALLTNK